MRPGWVRLGWVRPGPVRVGQIRAGLGYGSGMIRISTRIRLG